MTVWYLSFAERTFKGAVLTEADSFTNAYFNTLDINPGGQVASAPVPVDKVPDRSYFDRLLTKAEVQEFWPDAKTEREWRAQQK